jgi:hypothetical protein
MRLQQGLQDFGMSEGELLENKTRPRRADEFDDGCGSLVGLNNQFHFRTYAKFVAE